MSTIPVQNSNHQEIVDSLRAHRQQKEAIQEQNEAEIDHLNRSYAAQKADLEDRYETSVQAERLQHYENLKNLKSQIHREAKTLEDNGKKLIAGKTDQFRNEEIQTEKEGRLRVGETRRKMAAIEEYERNRMKMAADLAHQDHLVQTTQLLEENHRALQSLARQKQEYLDQQVENHRQSLNGIQSHYQGIRDQKLDQYSQELDSLEQRAAESLNRHTLASTIALSSASREKDSFYALQRLESQMQDLGHSFQLRIKVPGHERGNLRIQAGGDHIQVIGVRSSDTQALDGDRVVSTRSHQTFSEKIPLSAPIDPRSIERIDQDGWVEFRIPKQGRQAEARTLSSIEPPLEQQLSEPLRFQSSIPRPTPQPSRSGKGTIT
jgi:HSP20 family molecular chaperone IbpA